MFPALGKTDRPMETVGVPLAQRPPVGQGYFTTDEEGKVTVLSTFRDEIAHLTRRDLSERRSRSADGPSASAASRSSAASPARARSRTRDRLPPPSAAALASSSSSLAARAARSGRASSSASARAAARGRGVGTGPDRPLLSMRHMLAAAGSKPAGVYSTINPINAEREKRRFLKDPSYNPVFEYQDLGKAMVHVNKYPRASSLHLPAATRVLDRVIALYGNERTFLAETGGRLISEDECLAMVDKYCRENRIADVRVNFSPTAIAPTSMGRGMLTVRTPIEYREFRMEGVLCHELGTHKMRSLNDKQQVWNKRRKRFDLLPCIETEEGIASLHSHLLTPCKLLWSPALHYVSTYHAQHMSFSELNAFLTKYIDCPNRRWLQVLRAKRGTVDTARPGGFGKDAVYFKGAVELLQRRRSLDFHALYAGKIAWQDLQTVTPFIRKQTVQLPTFLYDLDAYRSLLDDIAAANGL